MAKPDKNVASNRTAVSAQTASRMLTVCELKTNPNLAYRILVLIHDLTNIKNNPPSAVRLERTVDEPHISRPYSTEKEVVLIKGAIVVSDDQGYGTTNERLISTGTEESDTKAIDERMTVEAATKNRFSNFCNKRKASGDFRPCGPHDMAPMYLKVFGFEWADLADESFLGRLRRSGLEDAEEQRNDGDKAENKKKKKKGKKT